LTRYEIGDADTLTLTVKVAGVLIDATVSLSITDPDGAPSSPAVAHPGTGTYTAPVLFSKQGEWTYTWSISGSAQGVDSGTIYVRPRAVMLCSVEDVELAARLPLGTFTGDDREAVKAAIIGVSARVTGWTGQNILKRQYVTSFLVADDSGIVLPQRPVRSIDTVTLDGSAVTAGLDYQLVGFELRRMGWRNWGFAYDFATVAVTYTAGYDVPPDDLSDVVAQRVAARIHNPQGLRQYSIGSFSATVSVEELEGSGWSAAELDVLKRYRRRPLGLLRSGRP
jgi:hypothetical protein